MMLAVMTRAVLGHTGRPLAADTATVVIYGLITVAAIARVMSGFWDALYLEVIMLSGAAWTAAFGLFVAHYGPMMARPRARPADDRR